MMKNLLKILLLLISASTLAQNIWEPLNIPDSLNAVNVNAEKDGILFVSATSDNGFSGLFRSVDDGESWELLKVDPVYNIYIGLIRYSLDGVLFVESPFGVWRSYDDGNSFELVSPDWNIFNINL